MGKTIAIGAVAVIAAFGIAFGIGKATAPKAETAKAAAPTPVQALKVAAVTTTLTSYDKSGAIPAPKKEKKKKAKKKSGGGGGGSATPTTPTTPTTPVTPQTPSGGGGGSGG